MTTFVLKRLVSMVPVLLLVSVVIFSLVHLTPGDPVVAMLGEEATPEARDRLRTQPGLDKPIPVQDGDRLANALRGALGRSSRTNQQVAAAISDQLPVAPELAIFALTIALCI